MSKRNTPGSGRSAESEEKIRRRVLGWTGIVATIALTISTMALLSATGIAKTPSAGTLDAEESAGTGTTSSDPPPPPGSSSATVDVTLSEWSIVTSVNSAKAGAVTFNIQNTGPANSHEFIILKTDIAPDALPTLSNKSLNESGSGITSPGESGELPVGKKQTVTVNMAAGKYVFVDNIVEKGGLVHWPKRAYATFTVLPGPGGAASASPAVPATPGPPPPTSVSSDGALVVSGGPVGGVAKATVHATPGASCSIVYKHPSGKMSTAAGLTPQTVGADGTATWTWAISANTVPVGQGSVTVTCGTQTFTSAITIR